MSFSVGKVLARTRFPALSGGPEDRVTVQVWARFYESVGLPPGLWLEAVVSFAEDVNGGAWETGTAKRAAFRVRDRWEADPEKRPLLERARWEKIAGKVERGELPPGALPPEPSHLSPPEGAISSVGASAALEGPEGAGGTPDVGRSATGSARWRAVRGELSRRARERRERESARPGSDSVLWGDAEVPGVDDVEPDGPDGADGAVS